MYLYPLMPLIIEEIMLSHQVTRRLDWGPPLDYMFCPPSLGRNAQNVIQRPRVGLSVGCTSRLLYHNWRPTLQGAVHRRVKSRRGPELPRFRRGACGVSETTRPTLALPDIASPKDNISRSPDACGRPPVLPKNRSHRVLRSSRSLFWRYHPRRLTSYIHSCILRDPAVSQNQSVTRSVRLLVTPPLTSRFHLGPYISGALFMTSLLLQIFRIFIHAPRVIVSH